jgi:hypothetical protein
MAGAAEVAGGPPEPGEGGETRAAERSAERAAALAVAEGFHPLRIRPYVAEPGGEPGATTVRPLFARYRIGPDTADLGLFPAMYSGREYAREVPDPVYVEPVVVRGRHRRRRRGIFVAAATVAASALAAGAVAVTGQLLADEPSSDQALPETGTSMPDVQLPDDAARATGTTAPPVSREAPASGSPTPSASRTVSAAPSTDAPTTTVAGGTSPATPSAPSAAAPAAIAPGPSATVPERPADPAAALPAARPAAPAATGPSYAPAGQTVLQPGDTGPAVTDLQQRLAELGLYRGPADGVFDREVQQAVVAFQSSYHVSDSADGTPTAGTAPAPERPCSASPPPPTAEPGAA